MDFLFSINWEEFFIPNRSILETFLRGSFIYLTLFTLLRLVLKREAGALGITDLLFVVLLASAVENSLAGDSNSITDGILLVGTLIFWNHTLNWLGFRFKPVQRFVHPPPLALIKDGQIIQKNLRRELITEDELFSLLRKQGVDEPSQVKEAFMEADGTVSVVTGDQSPRGEQDEKRRLG
jgi:uncharacterized membrane protein YcaP (DUF421 family)